MLPFIPTEDERDFMEVYRSNMPQLARLQRKMSVCLDVEVTEMEESKISFKYGKDAFSLLESENAFDICRALEKGTMDGLVEMASQGCVLKNGESIKDIKAKGALAIDEIRLLEKVANKFFFQIFLV